MSRKNDIFKLSSSKSKQRTKSNKSNPSLFDEDEYDFDKPLEMSEFDKAYKGMSSNLDNISFEKEYCKLPKVKQSNDLFDDEEDSITEQEQDFNLFSPTCSDSNVLVVKGESLVVKGDGDKKDRALAIAEDFVKQEQLIIVGGALYIYNGHFFTLLSEEEAKRLIFHFYRKEISRASPMNILRNAVDLLRYSTDIVLDEFPVNPNLIVLNNGTLEVDTMHFHKNRAKDLASSALGIDYDPDRWKMPCTKYFLQTIADEDDDLYELMLQAIGYILSNDIRAKSFFYLEGVGDAGKSRFCDLIASFFPVSGANKVARIALQDLGGKFALANLVNSKLNISEDLPDSPLSPTTVSRIKMISDSNRLEAEAKYVQAFSFKPQCKLLFASNHPLRLKEYDAAFINRVVYIPFLKAIPKHKQDTTILEKMHAELPALFNHAFKAYRRLVANGYRWAGADRFKPEIQITSSGISFDKERILREFVNTCCLFGKEVITPTVDLQYAYQSFCNERRYQPIMGDRFSRELLAVLPDSVTRVKIGNQRRGFKGIQLKGNREVDAFYTHNLL